MLRLARETDVSSDLPLIRVPALVLHRQGERQIPVDVSRGLAAALPNGTLVELAGSTATLFVEDLEGDIKVLVDFLADGVAQPRSPPQHRAARVRASDDLTPRELEILEAILLAIVASIPLGLGWLVLAPVSIATIYASYCDIFEDKDA